MTQHAVTLRRHPRLIVESFEDRRLLSSGPGLFSFSPEWLNSTLLNRSLDTRSLSVLTAPAKSNPVAEKDVHTQHEVSNEDSNRSEVNAELPTLEGGEDADGSGISGNEENGEPDSDSGGAAQIDDGPRGEPENLENEGRTEKNTDDANSEESRRTDSTDILGDGNRPIRETLRTRLEARASEHAASYPVVIQALKNTLHERVDGQNNSGNLGNQNVPTSDGETPSTVRDHSTSTPAYEARSSQEVSTTPANPPSAETRTEMLGPNRHVFAQHEGTLARADHVSNVDGQASGSLGHRPELPVVPARDVDRSSQVQGLQRGPTETTGTSRGQETSDGRQGIHAVAVAAESAVSVALQRAGLMPRQTTHVAYRLAEDAAEETPATSIVENAESAPLRLSIMDLAAFIPHFSGLMQGAVPFDQDAMQAAMQQFLEQMESLGGDAASWLAQMNLSPWVVAVAIGLTGCEVARRRQQQAQRGLVLTDDDGTPLTWFPGLAGLWTMRDA